LLSKVGTALRSGPPVVAGNQNCFDSGLGADLIDRIEIASLPRRFWKNAPYLFVFIRVYSWFKFCSTLLLCSRRLCVRYLRHHGGFGKTRPTLIRYY
jgi:hypothetical protein